LALVQTIRSMAFLGGAIMIPQRDFIKKPYDDDKMIYDKNKHQYYLKLDHAMYQSGRGDLVEEYTLDGSDDNAIWFMEMVSHVAYEYIRSFKDSKFVNRLTYYLSHSKQMREAIEKLMIDLIIYDSQEGGFWNAYVTGINLQEAQNITTIKLKTAVGLIGHQIVMNYGLGEREFKYDFDIEYGTYGTEW
jgi:hypothetical protein